MEDVQGTGQTGTNRLGCEKPKFLSDFFFNPMNNDSQFLPHFRRILADK